MMSFLESNFIVLAASAISFFIIAMVSKMKEQKRAFVFFRILAFLSLCLSAAGYALDFVHHN